jgi:hypothetical protein
LDVLQEAGVGMAAALAEAVEDGLAGSEKPIGEVFRSSLRAATEAAPGPQVRGALLGDIGNHPGRMTAYLADRGLPSWMDSATRLLAAGQQRGEIRSDYPARALAAVVLQAWAMSAYREKVLGAPRVTGQARHDRSANWPSKSA